jgi:TldD protein
MKSADFSKEEPAQFVANLPPVKYNAAEWAQRVRKLSASFANYPGILNSRVVVPHAAGDQVHRQLGRYEAADGPQYAQIMFSARGKASDGMDLSVYDSFEADDPARLPKDDVILAAIDKAGADLSALLRAPLVDPFVGPAILSGRASGVFFHEIFGHRIEGHRQKDEAEGQTFTKSLNGPVLPDFLSVVFDPTQSSAAGTFLNGAYAYDDEGVKARRVVTVDKGVLEDLPDVALTA